ncbi:hypothetical protein CEXT_767181 [Caerostris extrusa]|uniref:Reverse transcriptase domain-containing protein n=1 Tax=Caerostris extrusa TaxID=172846 RepID=A0AAV4P2H5_CAEEX|nr:hypothetical protein CEXT_767181 [Caerostris extrusa]
MLEFVEICLNGYGHLRTNVFARSNLEMAYLSVIIYRPVCLRVQLEVVVFFNLYINDLVSALKTVKDVDCLLFADDLVIWTQAPKRNAKSLIENKINKALDILSD